MLVCSHNFDHFDCYYYFFYKFLQPIFSICPNSMEKQLNTDCRTEPNYLKVLDCLLSGMPAVLHICAPACICFNICTSDCDWKSGLSLLQKNCWWYLPPFSTNDLQLLTT
jgi:hypothetical protein